MSAAISVARSAMYSRTRTADASSGVAIHVSPANFRGSWLVRREDERERAVFGELDVAVGDVRGHASRREADAGKHLEAEKRRRSSIAADALAVATVDHGQRVRAVGIDAADETRFGAHGEEPRSFRVDVE